MAHKQFSHTLAIPRRAALQGMVLRPSAHKQSQIYRFSKICYKHLESKITHFKENMSGITVFIRFSALGILFYFLNLQGGRLFEVGRLLNFQHFS